MESLGIVQTSEILYADQELDYRGYHLDFKYDQARKEW